MSDPKEDDKNVRKMTLRIPNELADTVQAMADKEHRSLHGQILALVEEAIAGRQGKK